MPDSRRLRLRRSHDARIDEWRGDVGDLRVFAVARDHDPDAMLARERDELGDTKTGVANLDRMTDRKPVHRAGEELEERAEVVRVEALRRRKLPVDRPKLCLSSVTPLLKNRSIDGALPPAPGDSSRSACP